MDTVVERCGAQSAIIVKNSSLKRGSQKMVVASSSEVGELENTRSDSLASAVVCDVKATHVYSETGRASNSSGCESFGEKYLELR